VNFTKKHLNDTLKYFCLFIGYPRSGHSIIGSIIDAHPNACISHEYDVVKNYKLFKNNNILFNKLVELSSEQAKTGRQSYGYSYVFEDLSQGKSDKLMIIGDKKGSGTTNQIMNNKLILDELEQFVQLPLKIIHITRNPFDIITTKASYKNLQKTEITKEGINQSIEAILQEAKTNQEIIDSNKYDIITLKHEDLIANTAQFIYNLFDFLELDINDEFIKNIASKLLTKNNKSRILYDWNQSEKEIVNEQIISLPIFKSYNFDT
jgi:hypothetical protein